MAGWRLSLFAMICGALLSGCAYVLPRPMTPSASTGEASAPSADMPRPPPLCERTSQPCRRVELSGR